MTPTDDQAGELPRALLTGRGLLPAYGSRQWAALPADDPQRWAAVLHAAECWWRYWQPDMRDLRAETTERDLRARLRAMCGDLATGLDWRQTARAPSYAELEAHRATPPRSVTVACAEPGCPATFTRPTHLTRPGQVGPRCWGHDEPGEVAA